MMLFRRDMVTDTAVTDHHRTTIVIVVHVVGPNRIIVLRVILNICKRSIQSEVRNITIFNCHLRELVPCDRTAISSLTL